MASPLSEPPRHFAAWQAEETRALVANRLVAIGDTKPSLRLWLHRARRLHQAWVKRELRSRCCPLSRWMATAIAGVLLWWKKQKHSVVALDHHNEGSQCARRRPHSQMPLRSGCLSLPEKTCTRHGRKRQSRLRTQTCCLGFQAVQGQRKAHLPCPSSNHEKKLQPWTCGHTACAEATPQNISDKAAWQRPPWRKVAGTRKL